MYDNGPLSTRQQLDALKLERERAKLLADQAKAQQQVNKVAETSPVPPVQQGVVPTVQGVDDPFQQWKNATMGAESSYGNNPKTWETNSSGARGLYQLTEATFNGLKKNGKIPKDYEFTNPVHNTEASEKLAEEVWNSKKVGQDPRKATAVWYSGPSVIDENGNIKSFKDPKNPDFPNTIEHVNKVEKIRLGGQQVPPVDSKPMRLDNAANDPRRTDITPPPPPVNQPTGREVLIARQDLLNSTDPEVRARAKAVLDAANQPMPNPAVDAKAEQIRSLGEIPRPPEAVADSRPIVNESVPVPSGVMEQELGNELGDVLPGETRPRQLTTEESISEIDKRISELDPNNALDLRTIQQLEADKEALAKEAAARGEAPAGPTVEEPPQPEAGPSAEEEADYQKRVAAMNENVPMAGEGDLPGASNPNFQRLGSQANQKLNDVEDALKKSQKQDDPKGWLAEALTGIFGGEDSLFTSRELIKFAILAAGGLLTGGSVGGSLKYAGLYALKSADAREAATAKARAEAAKDSRERYQQLRTAVLKDMDTLTTKSRNKVTELLNKASSAKSNAEGAAFMEQALAIMEKADTSSTKLKDPVAGYMYVPGRGQVAVTFRYNNGVPEIQTSPGVYAPIAPNARVESKADYNSEVDNLQKDIEAKVAPMLARLYEDEDFNSQQEARRLAVNIGLIRSELPEMSRPDFVRAAEMTIRSAVETSKQNGSEITEEGLRKALYGSSIIQLRRSNADMYTYKDSKGSRKPVDASYQSIIGRMYTAKRDSMVKDNPNYSLGMAAEYFEDQYRNLPDKVKKPFESLGNEPDNKAPGYLHWLKSIS